MRYLDYFSENVAKSQPWQNTVYLHINGVKLLSYCK